MARTSSTSECWTVDQVVSRLYATHTSSECVCRALFLDSAVPRVSQGEGVWSRMEVSTLQ